MTEDVVAVRSFSDGIGVRRGVASIVHDVVWVKMRLWRCNWQGQQVLGIVLWGTSMGSRQAHLKSEGSGTAATLGWNGSMSGRIL